MKAKGRTAYFEAAQVAGLDSRIWQGDGSATSVVGALFSLQQEVVKANGVAPLFASMGLTQPIYSMGVFSHQGTVDLVIQHASELRLMTSNGWTVIHTGLRVPTGPRDAVRMVQSADVLLIISPDGNFKWDGRKLTPLGIAQVPAAPQPQTSPDGGLPEYDRWSTKFTLSNFWSNRAIHGTASTVSFRYKMTWVNDKGQESEASSEEEITIPAVYTDSDYFAVLLTGLGAEPPQDDIIARYLYRSVDGGSSYQLLVRLSGTGTDTFWDTIQPGEEGLDTLALEGTNKPPPPSQWAFPFRTRTYYGGNPDNPSLLFVSRKQGGKEAVPDLNGILDVSSHDGDYLTGWALAQDYAVIFKRRRLFLLTHDKNEDPVLTPITEGVGAVSDRAIATFEGKVYFLSDGGFHMFDGSTATPLSQELDLWVRRLPPGQLENAHAWIDQRNRRVLIAVVGGPGDALSSVWSIHVDSGAFSILDGFNIDSAAPYVDEIYVGFRDNLGGGPDHYVGQWDSQGAFGADNFNSRFETRWLHLDSPQADKKFYRLDLFYVQSGDVPLTVDWAVDWDDRTNIGSTTVNVADPDATIWNEGNWDASVDATTGEPNRMWDGRRLRSARIDLTGNHAREAQGKCIRFGFQTAPGETPWRLVGFLLHFADHGVRAGALDGGAG